MTGALRFEVLITPNATWGTVLDRFRCIEAPGMACCESEDAFTDMVGRVLEIGITEIGLYWPVRREQRPMFERIATDVVPKLKAEYASS